MSDDPPAKATAAEVKARWQAALDRPVALLSIQELAAVWRIDRLLVRCRRPALLEDLPGLTGRLRGALGRQLFAMARDRPDPQGRSSAYDALFGVGFRSEGEISRPFALRVEADANEISIEMRLFGSAGFWLEEIAPALEQALAGGIALRDGGRQRVPFVVLDRRETRQVGINLPQRVTGALLRLESPVQIRQQGDLKVDPFALFEAARRRVRQVARWNDVALDDDEARYSDWLGALRVRAWRLQAVSWQRHSIRQRDAYLPVKAFTGYAAFRGDLDALAPYAVLAETAHLGGGIAFGLGRFNLTLFP